jgi:hypothetical protein
MLGGLLAKIIAPIFGVIDKAVADKDLALQLKSDLQRTILVDQAKALEMQAGIIVAEAQGNSWLQRSWRPITMLWFVGLVGAHWLGFTPANVSEAEVLSLLGLVKIGLGGYVAGRSIEKTANFLSNKEII